MVAVGSGHESNEYVNILGGLPRSPYKIGGLQSLVQKLFISLLTVLDLNCISFLRTYSILFIAIQLVVSWVELL